LCYATFFAIIYQDKVTSKSREGSTIKNHVRINEEIRNSEVRVIGSDGQQLGLMSSAKALELAREADVDLVEISPTADPPVVKIIDWGKYQYQKMKEPAKNHKKPRANELKQMRLGLKIGANDLDIKIRKIKKFLQDGYRVKIMIVFKGREMAHKEIGNELMDKTLNLLGDEIAIDQTPQMAGRNLSVSIRRK